MGQGQRPGQSRWSCDFPRVHLFGSQRKSFPPHPSEEKGHGKRSCSTAAATHFLIPLLRYPASTEHLYATPSSPMTSVQDTSDRSIVFLHPRPFAKSSGRLVLLPLLPHKPPTKPLPSEVWTRVFGYLYDGYKVTEGCPNRAGLIAARESLLHICKNLTVRPAHCKYRSRGYDLEIHRILLYLSSMRTSASIRCRHLNASLSDYMPQSNTGTPYAAHPILPQDDGFRRSTYLDCSAHSGQRSVMLTISLPGCSHSSLSYRIYA